MAYGKRAKFDEIRELAFGSLANTYSTIGAALTKNARVVFFTNTTDEDVYFSTDGSTDMIKCPSLSIKAFDISGNKSVDNAPFFFEVGTVFYCRHEVGSAPSLGWVSVEVVSTETGA